jgi:hypothetical protein
VFFADCCSLTEDRESSVFIAVTLKGTLLCRKLIDKTHILSLALENLRDAMPSILILFDDQFPMLEEIESHQNVSMLRKKHTLLFLPRVSLAPNPCMMVAKSIVAVLRERLCG